MHKKNDWEDIGRGLIGVSKEVLARKLMRDLSLVRWLVSVVYVSGVRRVRVDWCDGVRYFPALSTIEIMKESLEES